MADSEKPVNGNGNGGSVPISVLDRFIKLSQENSESYNSMVSAVDAISAQMMDLKLQVEQMNTQIKSESLAEVVNKSVAKIQADMGEVKELARVLAIPEYNLLTAIAEYFQYKKTSAQDLQAKAKAVVWFLSVVSFFQRNTTLFAFTCGALVVGLLGTAGMTLWDILQFIITHL